MFCKNYLTSKEISVFFDAIDEALLEHLHINPNPKLPHEQQRGITIKDLFTEYYRTCQSRYRKDEIEECRTRFMLIFFDNLLILKQIDEIEDQIVELGKPDNYGEVLEGKRNTEEEGVSNSSSDTKSKLLDRSNSKNASLTGTADATQMGSLLDKSRRVLLAEEIMKPSENKYMSYLDANARQVTHDINLSENSTETTNESNIVGIDARKGNIKSVYTETRSTRALDIIAMLKTEIPRVRTRFLECFSPLFYI